MTSQIDEKATVRIVFFALLLDILAFTMILPLFPEMINFYRSREVDAAGGTVLTFVLDQLNALKIQVSKYAVVSPRFDTVLLGGLVGSLFSFLQFIASPIIGRMSDSRGRRFTLLATMWGNILSTFIWVFASSFSTFLIARVVGGLSEGNVQLSIAIMSDVTSDANRSRALALVGIAFSVGFTVGPAIGAFMTRYRVTGIKLGNEVFNPFSVAAGLCLLLLVIETGFLWWKLPETHLIDSKTRPKADGKEGEKGRDGTVSTDPEKTRQRLRYASVAHFTHLFLFSGMEFSLTFLTFELFHYTPTQNGKLLGFVGIFASMIQGGYIRRKKSVTPMNDLSFANQGTTTCLLSFLLLAAVTGSSETLLWMAAACLAFTSATVVNCLTAYCSKICDPANRGLQMGQFRSWGQLGRSLGPILCCGMYWFLGKTFTYTVMSILYAAFFVWFNLVVKGTERKLENTVNKKAQ